MPTAVEIKAELESFYRGYIDAFNREDLDHFLDCFAIPYAWVSGERGLTSTTTELDHQKAFSRVMIDIKARGWARSTIERFTAWVFAENLGMIVADYTRHKTDGSILEQGRACYTVRRDGKSWKIVALSEIKPPFLGPGDIAR
jgi:ketosteroid isomerase-like protein